jgi:hypothetical protein
MPSGLLPPYSVCHHHLYALAVGRLPTTAVRKKGKSPFGYVIASDSGAIFSHGSSSPHNTRTFLIRRPSPLTCQSTNPANLWFLLVTASDIAQRPPRALSAQKKLREERGKRAERGRTLFLLPTLLFSSFVLCVLCVPCAKPGKSLDPIPPRFPVTEKNRAASSLLPQCPRVRLHHISKGTDES